MVVCPVCQSNKQKQYIVVKDWHINKCRVCGILYTVVDKKRDANKFYNKHYIASYKLRESILKERFLEHLVKIEKFKQGGRILDIGCGLGYFLEVTRQSIYKWSPSGVEPNTKVLMNAKRESKKVIVKGTLDALPFGSNQFDCVTCFDVLEHDLKLNNNLLEIKRVMKKGGLFVFQAPNHASLMAYLTSSHWDWWAPPDHLLHFSCAFIVEHIKKQGFKVIEKHTYERPEDFLSNLKGKFSNTVLTKAMFYLAVPLLVTIERISWILGLGGLTFVIARKI